METITNTTIYKCDHCGKKYFRKSDIVKHEKWCKHNPENKHKCFDFCKHLIKSREDIEGSERDYFSPPVSRCTFQCEKTKEFMYSFIAERRKIVKPEETRMPLECTLFESQFEAES